MAGCLGHTSNRPTCGAVIARRGEGMAFLDALVTVIVVTVYDGRRIAESLFSTISDIIMPNIFVRNDTQEV